MKRQAPDNEQTAEQVEAYYRNVTPGDAAVLRRTHGSSVEYRLDKIAEGSPKRGRIYIENACPFGGAAYWAKNGKSCWAPTGQSNLVVPTDEVMLWVAANSGPVITWDVEINHTPPGQRDGRTGFSLNRTRQAVIDRMKKK